MVRLAAIGLLLALSGCGVTRIFRGVSTTQVALSVMPRANLDQALAVDLVAVDDRELAEKLLAMPARDWFKQRPQIRLDFPKGFNVWSWEVVPGQSVEPLTIPDSFKDSFSILVFANYQTEGDHRARIGTFQSVEVVLQEKGFVVRPVGQ